jgi:hypothetical protein
MKDHAMVTLARSIARIVFNLRAGFPIVVPSFQNLHSCTRALSGSLDFASRYLELPICEVLIYRFEPYGSARKPHSPRWPSAPLEVFIAILHGVDCTSWVEPKVAAQEAHACSTLCR